MPLHLIYCSCDRDIRVPHAQGPVPSRGACEPLVLSPCSRQQHVAHSHACIVSERGCPRWPRSVDRLAAPLSCRRNGRTTPCLGLLSPAQCSLLVQRIAQDPRTQVHSIDVGSAYIRLLSSNPQDKSQTLPSYFRIEVREYESHGTRCTYDETIPVNPPMHASILTSGKLPYAPSRCVVLYLSY